MWDKRARVVDVHDGDTITVLLDQGFDDYAQRTLRLEDVYAPELAQPGGPETRRALVEWLTGRSAGSWPYIVTTIRTRTDRDRTTLGRYVARLSTPAGEELNAYLIEWLRVAGYGPGIGR